MSQTDPVDVIARTIWGEARSAGAAGMRHVASVIMNRSFHPGWWGYDPVSVCLKPYQFSCRNPGDPNLPKLLAVTSEDGWFAIAQQIAAVAMAGKLMDETGGADSYYALSMSKPPAWIHGATHTYSDGWHSFWRTRDVQAGNVSIHTPPPDDSADALNAAEAQSLGITTETDS